MDNSNSEVIFFDAKLKEEREYWLQRLDFELVTSSPLPDYPRPFDSGPAYAELQSVVPDSTARKLQALVGSSSFLLYTALAAALKVCLHKYTGHNTVLLGSPALKDLNRRNALVLVDQLEPSQTFQQLLLSVRENLLAAYSRQRYPFNRLVKDLRLDGVKHKCALFDVALRFEELHTDLPDVDADIVFSFRRSDAELECTATFNQDIYARETIQRFIDHYFNALEQGVAAPAKQIREISLMSEAEREQVLVEWNGTTRVFPQGCLHQLFETQAARTPDAVAVTFESEKLTYNELNQKANQLARELQTLGVGPEHKVCICMERSLEMVISILGVLKAGGAYVPLDPEYPRDRIASVFDDTQASVLLTRSEVSRGLPPFNGEVVCVDTEWSRIALQATSSAASGVTPDNLAYLIYTSGSTGLAKGVMISHRSIRNRLLWMQDAHHFSPEDRFLQKTPFTFDASIWEFFVPLMTGGRLTMARPGGQREAGYLVDTINAEQITVLQLVPTMLQVFLDEPGVENCQSLQHMFCGGEALSTALQERFYSTMNGRLHNLYGPTEISIDASSWDCAKEDRRRSVPIGRPISNMKLYVLDEQMQPAPVGIVGELYIGGVGLGRGYWNRPELTAERFVPHPFSENGGERLYRSGDLALCHPDKSVEYIGRRDYQVKIHGFRIELGEIELALVAYPDVNEAVVLAREDDRGVKHLIAYIVGPEGTDLSAITLRNYLRTKLPDYMLPSNFVMLERLPLTTSGKLNRSALPAPDHERPELDNMFVAPRTAVEELLADIWSQVLGVERLGVNDNFFDLGGHSLLATQIVSRTRQTFHVEMPLRVLFESPTIAGLARNIEAAKMGNWEHEIPPVTRAPRDQALPLSFTQRRIWLQDQMNVGRNAYNLVSGFRLSGSLDGSAMEKTITEIVRRHEVLRTTFRTVNDELVQVISPPQPVPLPVSDLTLLNAQEQEEEIRNQVLEESQKSFDLSHGPLLRCRLLRLGANEQVLLYSVHHVVSDGWSLGRLEQEVAALYEAFSKQEPSPLPELPVQYADFAVWQRNWLTGKVLDEQVEYWREQLAGSSPDLHLPTDYPRPAVHSYQGAIQRFHLPERLTADLKKLCKQEGVTMFMLLMAAWQTLLHRYTWQDDILVGSFIANRRHAEFEPLIGCLINTLIFRGDLSGNPLFTDFLHQMRSVAFDAYAHQDVPFDVLVETLQPERRSNYSPFLQVTFVLQNQPMKALELSSVTLTPLETDRVLIHFDLMLNLIETKGEIKGTLAYNIDIFREETAGEMLLGYKRLLEEIVAEPNRHLLDFPVSDTAQSFSVASQPTSVPSRDQFVI